MAQELKKHCRSMRESAKILRLTRDLCAGSLIVHLATVFRKFIIKSRNELQVKMARESITPSPQAWEWGDIECTVRPGRQKS